MPHSKYKITHLKGMLIYIPHTILVREQLFGENPQLFLPETQEISISFGRNDKYPSRPTNNFISITDLA